MQKPGSPCHVTPAMMENTNPDQWDPVRQGGLHGPHFSTAGWDQEFKVGKAPGLHPVEMLARIAKFEVRSQFIILETKTLFWSYVPQNGSLKQCLGQETSNSNIKCIFYVSNKNKEFPSRGRLSHVMSLTLRVLGGEATWARFASKSHNHPHPQGF